MNLNILRGRERIRLFNKLLAVFLLLTMLVSIDGCKPSPALDKIVNDEYAEKPPEYDSPTVIRNDESHHEADESLSPKKESEESEDRRDRQKDKAVFDANQEEHLSEAPDVKYDKAASADIPNETGDIRLSEGEGERQEAEAGGNGTDGEMLPAGGGPSEQSSGTAFQVSAHGNAFKTVVDGSGRAIDIPENVDRVSAVGEAAVMVRMLGGQGRLVAACEDFTANGTAANVFKDVKSIAALWKGNGSSQIADDAFRELIACAPQVCLEISGQKTFSNEQIASLSEKGISYVVLPELNTSANIKQAVKIIGEVLGDKSREGGMNAPSVADEYIRYYDAAINDVQRRHKRATHSKVDYDNSKNQNGMKWISGSSDTSDKDFSGKYSLFISQWDDSAYYKIYNSVSIYMEGRGAAVAKSGYSSSPVSYYMSLAGIVNTPAMYADFGETQNWYVNPMIPSTKSMSIAGSYQMPPGYYLTLTDNDISNNTNARTNGLGSSIFPGIIVDSARIKERIEKDPLWRSYGYIKAANGLGQNFGFLGSDGLIIESTVIGNYDIYVNPKGVGDWTKGSVESVLEPVWLSWKFQNGYTESEVRENVRRFYKTFYRYDLSESELNGILAGR